MKILAIDIGTTTGFAMGLTHTDKPCRVASINFKPRKGETPGHRYLRAHHWILTLLRTHQPDMVFFEDVKNHKGVLAAHVYGGILSQILAACAALSTPAQGVGVGAVKKHATGKGNASKEMMISAARENGYEPKDDNEADAIAIYHYAKEHALARDHAA